MSKRFRVIDLFSGAGGLTFGFFYNLENNRFIKRNNVEFVFSNEYDLHAVSAFKRNYGDSIPVISGDICDITDEMINEYKGKSEVDIIIGGPPCQSFSTVGQRKYDARAKLSNQYLRILETVKPKMFLFENVKGILSMREIIYKTDAIGNTLYEKVTRHRGDKEYVVAEPVIDYYGELVMDKLTAEFDRIGYNIKYQTMLATDFGVPQNRERVVIIGIRKDKSIDWQFPKGNGPVRSVFQAISDLPPVGEGETVTDYVLDPQNDYQELMRNGSQTISEHYCGIYGEKIRTVIQNVAEGEGKDDFNKKVEKPLHVIKEKLDRSSFKRISRLSL